MAASSAVLLRTTRFAPAFVQQAIICSTSRSAAGPSGCGAVEVHSLVVLDRVDRDVVDELQQARHDAAARDGVDGVADGHERTEGGGEGHRRDRWCRSQPQGGRGDHAESALGTDEQRREVVAGHVLAGAGPGVQHGTARQHDLEAHGRFPGDAVLDAGHAARVGRQVPADGADLETARVRRIEQAGRGRRAAQVRVDDPWFDDRVALFGVDLPDTPQPCQGQHDTAVDGVGATGKSGARAARDDRDPVPARPFEGGPHVVEISGPHDRARCAGGHDVRAIPAVALDDVRIGDQRAGGEPPLEFGGLVSHPDIPPRRPLFGAGVAFGAWNRP
jgi:hypothetical protein